MNKPKIKAEINTLFEEFILKQLITSQGLNDWIESNEQELDDFSEKVLAKIEPRLSLEIDGWLEEELKMKLLSPIFMLAELNEPEKFGIFFERSINAEFENGRISVVTDCMVSSIYGITLPQTPYFFMQEFKKSKGDKQDPEGQMLAAMIAAQHLNQNGNPLYGAFVVGRDWFFTILEGKNYTRSESFRLTQPRELRQVILALRKLKQIILTELMD
jgi:hypothetical protein